MNPISTSKKTDVGFTLRKLFTKLACRAGASPATGSGVEENGAKQSGEYPLKMKGSQLRETCNLENE